MAENPVYGPFFGVMGAASAIIFSCKYEHKCMAKYEHFSKYWLKVLWKQILPCHYINALL